MRQLKLICLLAFVAGCNGTTPGTGEDSGTPQQQVLDPAQCTISVAPATVVADGAAFARATVTLRDTAGAPIKNLFVGLSVSGTGNTLPSTASTDAQGKVVLGFTSTVAELKTVKAVLDPAGTPQMLPPEAQVTFIPGAPSQRTTLEWLTATAPADGTTPARARLTLKDANDNLISGATVTFSTSVTEAVVAPASGSTDGQGRLETAVTSTRSGAVTLIATVGGFTASASFAFGAGAPNPGNTTLTVAPTFTVADGVSSISIVTAVKDLGGTPVPNLPVSVSVTGSGNGLTNGTGSTASNGEHAAALTSTVAESKTITVSVANGAFSLNRTVSFQPGGPSITRSTLTASPGTIPIYGSSVLTLTTRDSQGNVIAGVSVGFSSSRDGGFVPDAGATDGGGVLLTTYTALQDGTHTVRATGASGFQVSTQVIVDGTCLDGQQNGQESDVDCGGGVCAKCQDLDSCQLRTDCVSDVCTGNVCQVPTCVDTRKNGIETDVDCGGDAGCGRCGDLLGCAFDTDCTSSFCLSGQCQVPACPDGRRNGIETDTDCGGDGGCARCNDTLRCANDSDCASKRCVSGFCAVPTCTDVRENGLETDVDCGGATTCNRCGNGLGCFVSSDCVSDVCDAGACQVPTCVDLHKNGVETDIDCGGDAGSCSRCADNRSCANDSDCTSTVCTLGTCRAPTCVDTHRNGFETDVDCGGDAGSCPRCNDTLRCANDSDCQSVRCVAGFCAAPTCTDARKNGAETDVDCGGSTSCPRCVDTRLCNAGTDCVSKVCSVTCQAPTCLDGVQNGVETDQDCGGDGGCPGCALNRNCGFDSDCQSLVCTTGTCRAPSCPDGRKNGFETDLDCGGDGGSVHDGGAPTDGGCVRCPVLQRCNLDSDCVATPFPLCIGGRCRELKFSSTDYGIGGWELGLAVLDRNRDGRQDLICGDYTTGVSRPFLNDGLGAFTEQVPGFSAGIGPIGVASGDLNGDGCGDIVYALFSDQLMASLCLPDGGMTALTPFSGGRDDVAVGDFNKDGKQDLVSTGYQYAYVHRGDGDGGFVTTAAIPGCSSQLTKVTVGDVDNDGNLDFVTVCNPNGGAPNGYAVVVRGKGDGSFFPNLAYAARYNPWGVALGDLHGDGLPEIFVTNDTPQTMSIFQNLGGGGFAAQVEVPIGAFAQSVVTGDFNADGFTDVAAANGDGLTIFLGRGDGTLSPSITVNGGSAIKDAVVADFNGDGKLDIATAGQAGIMSVMLSQCR